MNDIRALGPDHHADAPSPGDRPADRAQLLRDTLAKTATPEARRQRVAALRAAIARGEYDLDTRFELAVERLIDDAMRPG